jgi:hypothetical protein
MDGRASRSPHPNASAASKAPAVRVLQRAIERQFAALKYARNRRALTKADKAAVEIDVTHHLGDKGITIDLTRAANASAHIVARAADAGTFEHTLRSLFDATKIAVGGHLETVGAVVQLGSRLIDRGSPRDVRHWGFALIISSCIAFAGVAAFAVGMKTALEWHKEDNAHQERMIALNGPAVAGANGANAGISRQAQKALAAQTAAEHQEARLVAADELKDPLSRFVVAEAESTRPALLQMVALTGNISINGFEIPAPVALSGAKALKKKQKALRAEIGPWLTTLSKA